MALSSSLLHVSLTSCTVRFHPSKSVLSEKCRGFVCLKVATITARRDQRFKGCVLVRSSVMPDGSPLPSGSSGSWKGWIVGLLISLIFPMWRSKLSPLAVLKNKLDNVVQTAEDIADAVEEVAERVDKLAEELSEHLPEGGKLKHAVDAIEDLAEETAKQAHLLGEVIDKVQEVEENLEELIEHPDMALAARVRVEKAAATAAIAALEESVELKEDSSHGQGNKSLSS